MLYTKAEAFWKAHNECANFNLYKIEKTHKMGKLYKALLHKWKGKKGCGPLQK